MNKQQHIIDYINKEFGITISKTLASFMIDFQYKCNTKKIMTQKATRDIMGVTTQP